MALSARNFETFRPVSTCVISIFVGCFTILKQPHILPFSETTTTIHPSFPFSTYNHIGDLLASPVVACSLAHSVHPHDIHSAAFLHSIPSTIQPHLTMTIPQIRNPRRILCVGPPDSGVLDLLKRMLSFPSSAEAPAYSCPV